MWLQDIYFVCYLGKGTLRKNTDVFILPSGLSFKVHCLSTTPGGSFSFFSLLYFSYLFFPSFPLVETKK